MTAPSDIRVVVVDDHPFVRLGLRSFFAFVDGVEVVGEAASATEAQHVVDELSRSGYGPDVVLMDVLLPDGNGITTTSALRHAYPTVAVVVLTGFDDAERVRSALLAGAVGYVRKDAGPDDVLAAVRAAARGEGYIESSLALKLTEPQAGADVELTAREREVVALVGEGKSNQQIASELVITERTARTHVSNVLRKLRLSSRTQAALWATSNGLAPRQR